MHYKFLNHPFDGDFSPLIGRKTSKTMIISFDYIPI